MNSDFKKPVFAAVILLCAALLAGLVWADHRREQRRADQMAALQAQAAPYEQELQQLQEDLRRRENALQVSAGLAGAMPGFVPTSVEDVELVQELTADYDFTPTVVLNCALDADLLTDIARAAVKADCDLLLMGRPTREGVLETAQTVRDALPDCGYDGDPAFLLLNADDSAESRAKLAEAGFRQLFRYSEDLASGADDETLFLPYGFVLATTSGSGLARSMVSARTGMAVLFDLSAVHNGRLNRQNVTDCLDELDRCVADGTMEYRDIDTAFALLAEQQEQSTAARTAYDRYKAAQQTRIDALQQTIREIYGHWNEY